MDRPGACAERQQLFPAITAGLHGGYVRPDGGVMFHALFPAITAGLHSGIDVTIPSLT